MFATIVISLFLLGLSGFLLDTHRRRWLVVKESPDTAEHVLTFGRSQYRRRMQASGIVGLLGVAIAVWPLVPRRPLPMVVYLLLLVIACGWITMLALFDVWASRRYFRRLRDEQVSAQIKLAVELHQAKNTSEAET